MELIEREIGESEHGRYLQSTTKSQSEGSSCYKIMTLVNLRDILTGYLIGTQSGNLGTRLAVKFGT